MSSRAPFTVRDAAGKTHKLPAGKQELGPGLKLKLGASTKALPAPLVFSPGTAPLALGNRAYRGTLRVTGGKASPAGRHVTPADPAPSFSMPCRWR